MSGLETTVAVIVAAFLVQQLTQLLVPWMAWQSLMRRRIEWRGIDYQIDGPWKIRMVQYRPISAGARQPSVWKEGLIQPGD